MSRRPAKAAGDPLAEVLRPGQSVELLKELHILTRDGKLNQDSRRKLKQVEHLYQFIAPLLEECLAERDRLTLIDHGAGKSYLGFILYDLFVRPLADGAARCTLHGIEQRRELVEKSQALAARLGFDGMRFHTGDTAAALDAPEIPTDVDVVTALHACNTATDDALRFALARRARFIVLVPCCQAEVAAALRARKNVALGATPLAELWRHPIHTREFGSHLTNVLRCLLLEAHGYQLSVTELVGWEHAMKNELILARRTGQPRGNARARAEAILNELQLDTLAERFLYQV